MSIRKPTCKTSGNVIRAIARSHGCQSTEPVLSTSNCYCYSWANYQEYSDIFRLLVHHIHYPCEYCAVTVGWDGVMPTRLEPRRTSTDPHVTWPQRQRWSSDGDRKALPSERHRDLARQRRLHTRNISQTGPRHRLSSKEGHQRRRVRSATTGCSASAMRTRTSPDPTIQERYRMCSPGRRADIRRVVGGVE